MKEYENDEKQTTDKKNNTTSYVAAGNGVRHCFGARIQQLDDRSCFGCSSRSRDRFVDNKEEIEIYRT